MIKYLKLIRLPNLLMIPLTMYLLRYGIVESMLQTYYTFGFRENITLQFSNNLFLVVVLINVFLGAAGYVINDYFDQKIDNINRSDKVLIGKSIDRRLAMILHWVFNGIALLLAGYLAYKLWQPSVFILYALIAGIFWLYSTTYKKQLLIANIIVALGTATIPLQVAYFEIIALNKIYYTELAVNNTSFKLIFLWLLAFAVFAFLLNFIRELVKDIEDFEGDKSYGRSTLPIYFGVTTTKWVISILTIGTIAALSYCYFNFINDHISKLYLAIFVVIPSLIAIISTITAKRTKQYKTISWIFKITMLFGILYALVAKQVMIYIFPII